MSTGNRSERQDERNATAGNLATQEALSRPLLVADVLADGARGHRGNGALRPVVHAPLGDPAGEDEAVRHNIQLRAPRLVASSPVVNWPHA